MVGSKYQFMEMNLQKRMGGLKEKIPDIQKTLDSVKFLKLRKVWTARLLQDTHN
jgi:ribosomal protein L30/L7E